MKKILLLTLYYSLFITHYSLPQSVWFWQQPLPTGNFMYSVDFVNTQVGYASGALGTIMKTTNGGVSWNSTNISINNNLYLSSIDALDEMTALTSCNNIYRTSDGGNNWNEVYNSGFGNIILYLNFPTSNTGYAAGGISIILKTTNNGINWMQQSSPVTSAFYDVSFSDSNHGIIAASRGVLLTSTGGVNWTFYNLNLQPVDLVVACASLDSMTAYGITILHYFYKTTNGGQNWTQSLIPMDTDDIPRTCSFINVNTGYVVTSYGSILKTTDAGMTWKNDSTFNPPYYQINVLWSVKALDTSNVYVSGSGGKVIKSTNAGQNWILLTGGTSNLESNYFTSESTGYSVGYDGVILKTTNAGQNWIQQVSNTIQNLNDVHFVTSDVGYICGDTGAILKTTNGGGSWVMQISGLLRNLNGIFFTDINTGTAAGNNGKIIKTTDGGNNWIEQINGANMNAVLGPLFFVNTDTGFVVGDQYLRTTNGGSNWILDSGSGIDIFFPSASTGYRTGGSGIITKTTNGGLNWIIQNGNVSENLNSIYFINNGNGFAVGDGGSITRTTNGGNNWIPQISITRNDLQSVYFVNANTGFISGDFGTLLKTTNGGLVFISSNNNIVPNEYFLFQNYPNPFNSSTIIRYEIPKFSKVKVKLYNIEGKEINILVNEKQDRGSYELLFNASEIPAGIYFYSLYIDNMLMDTKKLILIK